MLADEDQLLHAVTILLVPVATQARVLFHELLQLIFRHCGVPLSGIAQANLLAGLLKDVADVLLVFKPADTLGAYDTLGPLASNEFVEQAKVEGTTGVVNVSADAILFGLALFVVMVMVMTPCGPRGGVFLFVMMVVVNVPLGGRQGGIIVSFHLLNPACRGGYTFEVEHVGIDDLIEVDVAIVGVDDFCLWLQCTYNLPDASQFIGVDFGCFVEQDDIAELYLLDDQVLYVFLFDVFAS